MRKAKALLLALVLAACAQPVAPPPGPAPSVSTMALTPLGYDQLEGWGADQAALVVPALRKSCKRLSRLPADRSVGHDGLGGTAADWLGLCAAAERVADTDHAGARALIETWLRPWRVLADGKPDGLFTGYFEPEIRATRHKRSAGAVPIWGKPSDLVTVDLGRFRGDWAGETLVGRLEGTKLLPYPSRAEIDAGALEGKAPVLAWAEDPVELAIMHIQGSGRLKLEDGTVLRLGVAGTNGHKFVGIGKVMKDEGLLEGDTSMPAIRAWLKANPEQGRSLLARNPRFVFYAVNAGEGPLGTEGVALTAERSLAVDPRFIPLGVPVWVETHDPDGRPFRRLMMAQDTGAAIKGPVRGDVFWGAGEAAFRQAGRMKSPGRMVLFLPATRSPRVAAR